MTKQKFGGIWTVEKLNILSDYLDFYLTALKNQKFKKIYIDAFAGTGKICVADGTDTIDGSAKLSLNAKHKFDEYIFVEKNKQYYKELNELIDTQYPEHKNIITTYNKDCNDALKEICSKIDWRYNRALLFLDPYASELEWDTLKIIAETKAIDVWYLFPFSVANRLLKKDKHIDETWKAKLNSLFGDDSWETELYKRNPQLSLFDGDDDYIKDANTEKLTTYICNRLKTIFPSVSPYPRVLFNTKNSPLFCFCFAVSNDNPRAQGLALKVANHILKKEF